ncbi:hypothetical protein THASP1DRAFT_4201, partial [Thamnocephalis sphaerospora]
LIWLEVVGAVLVLALLCTAFTKYYQDPAESEPLVTTVTVIGLTFCLCILTLAPLDIYLVSSTVDQATGLKRPWATPERIEEFTSALAITYYGFFISIVVLCFVVIPFAYFYFEELELDRPTQQVGQRAAGAAKYTLFTVSIATILLICGMVLRPKLNGENPRMDFEWFRKLLLANGGVKAITFVVAVLILGGMFSFVSHTAYGMSVLPIKLLRGRRLRQRAQRETQAAIERIRIRRRTIQSKYENAARPASARDSRILEDLEQRELDLARRATHLSHGDGVFAIVPRLLRPLEILGGIVSLCLSLTLVASVLLTCIDKVKHSVCGQDCGYVLSHPEWFNPVNVILLYLSEHFPLDYIFVVAITLYFFAATAAGLVQSGIRFLWVHLYQIKAHRTAPQGLLLASIILMLSLLALNYTMTTVVAPQYAHFGSQLYCNHTISPGVRDCSQYPQLIVPCDIEGPPGKHTEICTPTVLSTFIYRILVNLPAMGTLFFDAQWVFVGIFFIGLL